ncbi:DUF5682 family protein [Streptomyces sp. NPDC088925]|uniref:DUF5682 family protein n=1 Tax=Streptomyces sp. NPDC088925 TaxID=3365914 RepID=UPI003829863E
MSRPKAAPLLLGVRHHGPGSARAVRAALDAARPAVILIEGPPEADALAPLAADPGLRPPVALLAHLVDEPARSAFWPFAAFSPEWTALRWAAAHEVPVRFIDLPAANSLAMRDEEEREPADGEGDGDGQEIREDDTPAQDAGRPGDAGSGDAGSGDAGSGHADGDAAPAAVRIDPVAVLAETAGYDDPERWWEDVVEHRSGPAGEGAEGEGDAEFPYPFGAFAALAEAMTALRERYADGGHPQDAVREAHMRLCLRAAEKEFGPEAVAVVCGAWHVPALATRVPLATDRAALRGLPKAKTALTWVPWTHRRLARASGYGAGIESPGWYGHLFAAPDRPVERWLTQVAGLLREEDKHVSSAHVIEAVRLAETLAVMRGRPLAGLGETMDAVRSVMCEGSDVPLALVHDRLVVGDVLGEVPDSAPAMPLQRDLTRLQRALRLKPEALERTLELDLRKDNDVARSGLLHRLRLLGVDWGVPAASHGSTGTFRETWTLRWDPELAVRVAEAGIWGTTVLGAAEARASARAAEAKRLGEITALVEACLPAALSESLPHVMRALADLAALDTDVARLAEALPALVRTLRYGDVRGTDTGALTEVAAGLAERVFVGLPPACAGLDEEGAEAVRKHLDAVHGAVGLLADSLESGAPRSGASKPVAVAGSSAAGDAPGEGSGAGSGTGSGAGAPAPVLPHDGLRRRWYGVLRRIAGRDSAAGVVRGRCARLLLDVGEWEQEEAARVMGLALSPGTAPAEAAAWIDGFVGGGASGGGLLLVHDERLLGLVDEWLVRVPPAAFTDVLPLLRRTFSAYEPAVRRSLGELVRRGPGGGTRDGGGPGVSGTVPGFGTGLDEARAAAVVPVVLRLLGRAA